MPLVEHNSLPTYERLRREGQAILDPSRAESQDIRPLRVGLLNMMPDAALAATERQFFRLVGSSNPISQFYMHPFTLAEIPRGESAREHIEKYYDSLEDIKALGLDALIITGANVTQPDLPKEVFWEPLIEVVDWAHNNVASTLCSCLASHAVMQFKYGLNRRNLGTKRWGVYAHDVKDRTHPLVHDINTRMHVPHSRFNEISREQMASAGLHVLIESDEAGVQLAVSEDGFRIVFFQGHPEYDNFSLLKEFKREVGRYINHELAEYPPFPKYYFDSWTKVLLEEYQERVIASVRNDQPAPVFPENHVLPRLANTWHDTGEAIVGTWIGWVYQVTHSDVRNQFMDSVDPGNPLDWSGVKSVSS